ncbi:MAG: FtsX-like permease family protein, partial [Candidatus Krumholzibacteria bacterium]|nr:FtsX-like permease family protein [Candidatus Krumholzibacteria bacterium]
DSRTLFLLSVFGVSLGVASVVAIQTLNRGALEAFNGSVRAVSGQADLSVVGTMPAFPESLLVTVLGDHEVTSAWPICRVDAAVTGTDGLLLDIVGVDLLAPVQFPVQPSGRDTSQWDPLAVLRHRNWVAVTPDLAGQQEWSIGDTITVSSGSRNAKLVIGALVDFQVLEPMAPRTLAVMDIGAVQTLLARHGLVHQIDLTLDEGVDPLVAANRMAQKLGPGVRVLTPEQRGQDAAGLLKAFRMNLTALSLISVFVGLFLVLTTVQASLARRRREYGVLRCLGADPGATFWLIIGETGVLGLLGVVCGLPLGYAAALQNLHTVSATLTNIYVLEGIDRLQLPADVVALGAAVGILGAMAGAAYPAWEMSRRETLRLLAPVSLHQATGRQASRLTGAAAGLAAATSIWFFAWGTSTRWGGFVYGALMMIALPLVVPAIVQQVGRLARPDGMGLALSLRNLVARLQTTSFAVAALAVTVSMLVGITLLVGSFRETLITWLDTTVQADVYVTTESWVGAGNEAFLDRGLLDELAAVPGVAAVEEQRRLRVHSADGQHLIWLSGIKTAGVPGAELAGRLPLQTGSPEAVAAALAAGQVLIGEPLARKAQLAPGDTLVLAGPTDDVRLTVAGIAFDYTSEGGTAFVTMSTLQKHFGTRQTNNAALFLESPDQSEEMAAALKARFQDRPLVFRSNRNLRQEVLDIFDQTFAVTRTLQSLALLTAVCGISLTLLVQSRQRTGELALLRTQGATRTQIFGLFLGEGAAMGALGLILGLLGGIGLAALLILNVNRQWFGWTIQPAWPMIALLQQGGIVMVATLVAAAVPAYKAGLAGPEQLVRDDL